MKIVAISDTHGMHRMLNIPECDILIHAGDITWQGEASILRDFNDWLADVPADYKVVIPGNHDRTLEDQPNWAAAMLSNATYLDGVPCEIAGISIYGFPWTPTFGNWAFMADRGEPMRRRLRPLLEKRIQPDIVVSHGPPHKILDKNEEHIRCGCRDLKEALRIVSPKLHIFGHIHEAYGIEEHLGIKHVNASVVNRRYNVANEPVVIDYD